MTLVQIFVITVLGLVLFWVQPKSSRPETLPRPAYYLRFFLWIWIPAEIVILGLCLFFLSSRGFLPIVYETASAAKTALGIVVFRMILDGFRFRLLLMPVPPLMKGWRVELLAALLLGLTLSLLTY